MHYLGKNNLSLREARSPQRGLAGTGISGKQFLVACKTA
jgi:hypothetical protein